MPNPTAQSGGQLAEGSETDFAVPVFLPCLCHREKAFLLYLILH